MVRTYVNLTRALGMAGRNRDAIDDAQQGYQRARELGLERAIGSLVANNLAWDLLTSGRWGECEQLTQELLAGDTWCAQGLHACRGRLLTWRGDFAAARAELDLAVRLTSPAFADDAWRGVAELALWESRYEDAGAAIAERLQWWAETDPEGSLPQLVLPWYTLALWLEADRAEQAEARRAAEHVAEARQRAAPVIVRLDRLATTRAPQARYPSVTCRLLLARAELSRLQGASDPKRWRVAAAAWERLERPFEAAYARFRLAEALLADRASRLEAEQALRTAHHTAVTLGAGPLRREIELLARRGRLRLEEQVDMVATPKAPTSPTAVLGLTHREAEVLALLAEGQTNRQIGQQLSITEKTASLHVSHILAKLGVAGRGQAAAVAHRLGLDKR